MSEVDLNLLVALDVLLAGCSVTRAAEQLGLSPSAMSRTLTRLRLVTGDPLLVRAGRGLVPTPRALELRDQVREVTRDARGILRPQVSEVDMASVEGTFTIRASQSFMERLSGPLVTAVSQLAPRICLTFEARQHKDVQPLREGAIDLDIGLRGTSAPEIRTRFLFHDVYVGAVRFGHPLLKKTPVTAEDFAAFNHVVALQEGRAIESLTDELESSGLKRQITVVVPGYPDALRIACQSELIAVVPHSSMGGTCSMAFPLVSFDLPAPPSRFQISAMWHPRMDADPIHRRLRNCIISSCQEVYPIEDD